MRNFGVIRSAVTGDILRMAPNFDNNQAYKSNPGGHYSDAMLRSFEKVYGFNNDDRRDLESLLDACKEHLYLLEAHTIGQNFLSKHK